MRNITRFMESLTIFLKNSLSRLNDEDIHKGKDAPYVTTFDLRAQIEDEIDIVVTSYKTNN